MSALVSLVLGLMLLGTRGSLEDVKFGSRWSQEDRVDEQVGRCPFLRMRVGAFLVELNADLVLDTCFKTHCRLHFDVSAPRVDSGNQEVIRRRRICTESVSFGLWPNHCDLNVLPSNGISGSIVTNDDVVLLGDFDQWVDGDDGSLHDLSEPFSGPSLLMRLCWPLAGLHFSTGQVGILGFIDVMGDVRTIEGRVGGLAPSSTESLSTLALSSAHVTSVIIRASNITIASLATIHMLRESVVFRQTLIAVLASHQPLTSAHSSVLIASLIVISSQEVASTGDTAVNVGLRQIPVSVLASVTSVAINIRLTVALSGDKSSFSVFFSFTDSLQND